MNQPSPADTDSWFLSGPTAGGKTAVGIELALLLNAEIVSLDSMALYRGMDIGTAKPTAAERKRVPHHLIDVIEPEADYSLAQYVDAAHQAVADIRARGRVALFVGGTPLYLKALLRGIFSGPPADWTLRHELQAFALAEGQSSLHARLAAVDPQSARRLHPRDTRRIIRALEVWQLTGRSITELQQQFDKARPAAECRVFVLNRDRDELCARIDARVERMFADGLLDEVRRLVSAARPPGRTASQSLGYREVIEHLDGVRGLPETVALVQQRTRQFAKRQMTWFRSLSECRSIPVTELQNPREIAASIRRMAT